MPDNTIISNLPVFLGCDAEYEESSICVFGAPFDSTTSFRPGTRFCTSDHASRFLGS